MWAAKGVSVGRLSRWTLTTAFGGQPILETGNDSYRFNNSSAQPIQPKKESKPKKISTT